MKNKSSIRHIHIVDDDPVNSYAISRILKKLGYETSISESGNEALPVIRENKPDLVIADVIMPVMTGFELLSRLKSSAETKHIPVLLVSGLLNSKDHIKTGLNLGAVKILKKPVSEKDLKSSIEELESD